MQKSIIKLLEESGYEPFRGSDEPKAFIGKDFEDCVIICEYTQAELDSFASDKNAKTKAVMNLYSKVVATHDNAFKDTILIICHRVNSIKDLDESSLRNTILRIEENKYGLRAYVLPYTSSAEAKITQIQQHDNFTEALVSALQEDQDGLESRLEDETYFTVTQLFIKLPFLQIDSLSSGGAIESLDVKLAKAVGQQSKMKDLIVSRNLEEIIQLSTEDLLNDYAKIEEQQL